jgi:hypothetical protein
VRGHVVTDATTGSGSTDGVTLGDDIRGIGQTSRSGVRLRGGVPGGLGVAAVARERSEPGLGGVGSALVGDRAGAGVAESDERMWPGRTGPEVPGEADGGAEGARQRRCCEAEAWRAGTKAVGQAG